MARNSTCWIGLFLALTLVTSCAQANDYLGAAGVLKRLEASTAGADAIDTYLHDLDVYAAAVKTLPPKEAGARWLELALGYISLPNEPFRNGPNVGFRTVLAQLPPPAAWDEIAARIQARLPVPLKTEEQIYLSLLAHTLKFDLEGQVKDLEVTQALVSRIPALKDRVGEFGAGLADYLAKASNNPDLVLRVLKARLALDVPDYNIARMSIPPLVAIAGVQRAEEFLKQALRGPYELEIEDEPTRLVAMRLALQEIDKLKAPQWAVAQGLDSAPLFQALTKWYPGAGPPAGAVHWRNIREDVFHPFAQMYYPVSLAFAGKLEEAVSEQEKGVWPSDEAVGRSLMHDIEGADQDAVLAEFFRRTLLIKPELPSWNAYLAVAARRRELPELLLLLGLLEKKPELSDKASSAVRDCKYQVLLQLNRIPEAAEVLRGLLGLRPGEKAGNDADLLGWSDRLARLGKFTGNPQWLEEGVRQALAAPVKEDRRNGGWWETSRPRRVVKLLVDLDRGAEAERFLVNDLTAELSPDRNRFSYDSPVVLELTCLAGIYHRAGRYSDVLDLLQSAPGWSTDDLRPIQSVADTRGLYLGYLAASALAETGKPDQSVPLLKSLLTLHPDYDPAYELLVRLEGAGSLPYLAELGRKHPLEERPLLWRGAALRQSGKLPEAEKAVRAAISLAPTDGDQGFGRSMRAYAVLAEIRESLGDRNEAAALRARAQAARLGEQANSLLELGMPQQAIGTYEEALKLQEGSALLQSRLAVLLDAQGRAQEAEAHYRRAFALMPDAIGRRETQCFFASDLFRNSHARAQAAQVLTQQVAAAPGRAQTHFLLGCMNEALGNYEKAVTEYRNVVSREPDFLDAWQHLLMASDSFPIPAAERNRVGIAISRLDPTGLHPIRRRIDGRRNDADLQWMLTGELKSVHEAAALALADETAVRDVPLLALPGSAAYESGQRQRSGDPRPGIRFALDGYTTRADWIESSQTPGEVMTKCRVLQFLVQHLEDMRRSRRN